MNNHSYVSFYNSHSMGKFLCSNICKVYVFILKKCHCENNNEIIL